MHALQKNTVSWLVGCSLILSGCSGDTDQAEKQATDAAHQESRASAGTLAAGQPSLPAPADTSRLALDWAGTYSGIVPCANCPGIKTVVTLHDDGSYRRSLDYIDESSGPAAKTGTFTWNDAGSSITLNSDAGAPDQYQVGEHRLFQLDMQGQRIEGDLAEHYILHQHLQDPAIEDSRWELIELNGKPIEPEDYQTPPFLVMQSETSRIMGNASCNSFTGAYTIKSNQRIDFGDNLAMTRMACPDMSREQAFVDSLATVVRYAIEDDGSLIFHDARAAPLARLINAGEPE